MNARLRPRISPTFPPVIISDAITSVYIVIAVWIPVTVVSRSWATVAIAVFITVVSSAITNWPAANVSSTIPAAPACEPVESDTCPVGLSANSATAASIVRIGTPAIRRKPRPASVSRRHAVIHRRSRATNQGSAHSSARG